MKQIAAIITAAILIMSLALTAFAAESIAVKFEDAAGKTATGGTEPIFQMTDHSEFVEETAVAVTFTSDGVPYLNLRSKTSPFSDSDNVWMFMEPSSITDGVAYFDYADVKELYLNGVCEKSGTKTVDLQSDFEKFLNTSCDWIGIYTYDNTVTVTKIEIVKAEAAPEVPEAESTPEVTETASPADTSSEPEAEADAPETAPAPATGIAVAVIPTVMALAAVAVSKKR